MEHETGDKGALVCFEGGDGAGKTTLALSVADELRRRGLDPVILDKKSVEGFQEPYLVDRLRDLRKVLWDYPQEAPLWEWGDPHWFHLLVSWFSILDHCRVRPLLREGRFVIIDNWYYKFAARFLLKQDFDRDFVLASFRHLTIPDLVVFVDIDPQLTVTRRAAFSATESGRMDGHAGGGAKDFISYQTRVLQELRRLSTGSWGRLDAACLSQHDLVLEASNMIMDAASRLGRVRGS